MADLKGKSAFDLGRFEDELKDYEPKEVVITVSDSEFGEVIRSLLIAAGYKNLGSMGNESGITLYFIKQK